MICLIDEHREWPRPGGVQPQATHAQPVRSVLGDHDTGQLATPVVSIQTTLDYLRVTPAAPAVDVLALLGRLAPFAYASANECLSEVAELDAVNVDLGPHGPVRPGHGGLGALGDFDQLDEHGSGGEEGGDAPRSPDRSVQVQPMGEEESSDAVLETPPPSPH